MLEKTIKIEHQYTTYFERVKYWILLYLGAVSTIGICLMFDKDKAHVGTFLIIMSLLLGVVIAYNIYQNRLYIYSFYSDSENVKIGYPKGSQECSIETTLDYVSAALKNTSSRGNFDCQIILSVEKVNFVITIDFDWTFNEMKQLFEYVTRHKLLKKSEKEKSILQQIDNYLEKYPF